VKVKEGYKYFIAAVMLVSVALVSLPQSEVLITPLNASTVRYIPLTVSYNNSMGVLILTSPTMSSIVNEFNVKPPMRNLTQAVEFSGFLILNNRPYLAYGVMEVQYTPKGGGLIKLVIYISSTVPLKTTPQLGNGGLNSSQLVNSSNLNINGTSEGEFISPVGPINPYVDYGNNTMIGRFIPPGLERNMRGIEAYTNTTSTTALIKPVNALYPPSSLVLLALGLVSVLLTVLVVAQLRVNEDCAVRGMRRITGRLNKVLRIYRPDLTSSDVAKYLSYFTSDHALISSVISMYEKHIYGDEPINCREYNRLVRELARMIKRF